MRRAAASQRRAAPLVVVADVMLRRDVIYKKRVRIDNIA